MAQVIAAATEHEPIRRFHDRRQQESSRQRLTFGIAAAVMLVAFFQSAQIGDVNVGHLRDINKVFDYISETIPTLRLRYLGYDLADWFGRGRIWVSSMFDTILIAIVSTTFSAIAGFVLCFAASRNLVRNRFVTFVARRTLEIARGVPELVYAMIFVFAFELGPLPGVLAIAVHSAGSLGKLFSEVNENVAAKSLEGVRSVGGNWFDVIRYAVVPQVMPNFASYTLLRLELNVRAATVIGLVGAGGIGMELMTAIRQFHYTEISAISLMVVLVVVGMDWASEKIRHSLIGKENLV
ncbi:MAG: phosphonate ABC transporter, permease protein PhnE [Spirochaetota bacterium]